MEAILLDVGGVLVLPHPTIFRTALRELGVPAERAVHLGDDTVTGVAGAEATGIHALRVGPYRDWADRSHPPAAGVDTVWRQICAGRARLFRSDGGRELGAEQGSARPSTEGLS